MQKILLRRTVRDFKANTFRYLTLFLLIVLAMFMVVSTVASAESVIKTVDRKAEAHHLEDGQFGMFLPLTDRQMDEIKEMNVSLEPCFYLDFQMSDDATLRLMKNRQRINLLELEKGRLAKAEKEVVIERIYADAHNLVPGNTLLIAGEAYTVTGIATSPDYDQCLQNLSDMSSDGKLFGTAFVTSAAYDQLRESGKAIHSQEYRYSYRLGKGTSSDDLKHYLLQIEVDTDQVKDPYFQQMIKDSSADRDEMRESVKELSDGASSISKTLDDLADGSSQLDIGIAAIYSGLAALDDKSGDLVKGSAEVLSTLRELESATAKLSSSSASITNLREASALLLIGTRDLNANLQKLSAQVTYERFHSAAEAALRKADMNPSDLSPDAQVILGTAKGYLTEVNGYLTEAAKGSASLNKNFSEFDHAMDTLPDAILQLNSSLKALTDAVTVLRTEYESLDSSVTAYTDGVAKIFNGYEQIAAGSKSMAVGSKQLSEKGEDFYAGVSSLQKETNRLMNKHFPFKIQGLTDFLKAADNPRIKAANDDVSISINVGLMAGAIVLILLTYVISVFVIHSIDRESAMIGALYALGIKRKQLMLHYTMLPVVLCLLGGIVGTALGYSDWGITVMSGASRSYYSTPIIETFYSPYLLIYGLILPPLIALIVNRLIIGRRLSRTALSLLRKEQPAKKFNHAVLKGLGFIQAFQIRQFLREKRSCFAVLAGIFVSLLILILGLNCYALCRNVQVQNAEDTKYTYMYQYKYPAKSAPAGGHAAYIEGLKKEALGYNMEVSFVGIEDGNPFFPFIKSEKQNEISISTSVAEKYGLSAGDKVLFSDEISEKDYGFVVKEVVPYSVGLTCFMNADSMRTLFDREEDYYNVIYADHALDVDTGRLYSVSTKEDVEKSSEIFMEIMIPLISMMTGAAALIFLIVLYQMMKVMIDRSASSISLMKIFGYRNNEIRKLYLDGSFLLIAVGSLVLLPLAKVLMDLVYPMFIANVACGIDLTWPPVLYAIVYVSILLGYLLIRMVLVGKLKKVAPAEVLKDRE